MNYVKLSDGTILNKDQVDDSYSVAITRTDVGNFRIKLSELGRHIKESLFQDYVTIDDTQTLTSKRLDLPMINSDVDTIIDSETLNRLGGWDGDAIDINKLTGIPTTKSELSRLSGIKSNIQDQLDAVGSSIEQRLFQYSVISEDVTDGVLSIQDSKILLDLGISNNYAIRHETMVVSAYADIGSSRISNQDSKGFPKIEINTKENHVIGRRVLDDVVITLADSTIKYATLNMLFKVINVGA